MTVFQWNAIDQVTIPIIQIAEFLKLIGDNDQFIARTEIVILNP